MLWFDTEKVLFQVILRERGRMSESVYVRVVHDLELLCSLFCDRTTALFPTGINKVYCIVIVC